MKQSTSRVESRAHNRAVVIDFDSPLDVGDFNKRPARGTWKERFAELARGVEAGDGEPNKFYLLGEFSSPGGAQAVIWRWERDPDGLPFDIALEHRRVNRDGIKSELWGAIPDESFPWGDE